MSDQLELFEKWMIREEQRFTDGTYDHVPWVEEDWWAHKFDPHHYPHPSTNEPGMLAYTPDAHFGEADRQVTCRPGKYLRKFFNLTDVQIEDAVGMWKGAYNPLLIAMDAEEIEWVYRCGPSSCMGQVNFHDLIQHPCYAYGAGDLGLAYYKDGDGDPAARTVVWPEKRIHSHVVYGDQSTLRALLRENSYNECDDAGDWEGARLLRVLAKQNDSETLLIPYLDIHAEITAGEEFLYIGDLRTEHPEGKMFSKLIIAQSTDGTSRSFWCEICQEFYPDGTYLESADLAYCFTCYEEHTFTCEACMNAYPTESRVDVQGDILCVSCTDEYTSQCPRCEYLYYDAEGKELDKVWYCEECYDTMIEEEDS
jgi:hypothetical protein